MSVEDLLVSARRGDHDAFGALVEPHRRELLAHCYRMLGSLQDAEDALQDALLSAWVGLPGFDGRSSLRTWLFRVVTNRCLNALRTTARRPVPADPRAAPVPDPSGMGEVPWLQPYPDLLLEGLPDAAPGPEARYETREAISLAFVTAVQLLPPRQRAVLLLRDVLGYRAAEAGHLLGLTLDAVNSAVRRARATLRAAAVDPESRAGRRPADAALVDRFVDAFTGRDVDALLDLMSDDVWLRMPPLPFEYRGRDAVRRFLVAIEPHRRAVARMVPVGLNARPGWGEYVTDPATGLLRIAGILVADNDGDRITDLVRFEAAMAPCLGLPRTLTS